MEQVILFTVLSYFQNFGLEVVNVFLKTVKPFFNISVIFNNQCLDFFARFSLFVVRVGYLQFVGPASYENRV